MSTIATVITQLDGLLVEVGARPRLQGERIARSTLYDPDYHVAMVACAFNICAEQVGSSRRILRGWLKLLQFVATRPRLAHDLLGWASTRRQATLETWRRMPRGYIGDQTHDAVLDLLVARSALAESGDWLLDGSNSTLLDGTYHGICEAKLFATERNVMNQARELRVSKAMLGGQ
jgi:hypothetical protein